MDAHLHLFIVDRVLLTGEEFESPNYSRLLSTTRWAGVKIPRVVERSSEVVLREIFSETLGTNCTVTKGIGYKSARVNFKWNLDITR